MIENYDFKLHYQERHLFGMGYLSKDQKDVRDSGIQIIRLPGGRTYLVEGIGSLLDQKHAATSKIGV